MSEEIIRPKIDLRQQETVKCEKCESTYFKEITFDSVQGAWMLFKESKLS